MRAPLMRRALLGVLTLVLVGGGAAALLWLRSPGTPASRQLLDEQIAAAKIGFTLSASPTNLNVPAGTQGSYAVTISRTNITDAVAFSVTGLPPNSTATFAPTSTTGNSTTLYITTSSSTGLGSYTPVITGTSTSNVSASTTVRLTISAGQSKQFTISGSLDHTLAPGVTGNLDLALSNPNNQPITVSGLTVAIAQVSKSACTATGNFSIKQFTGSVTVPANSTKKLSVLGVTNLPQVTMVDLPTNQDACKGATLTLTYTGTGQGA